MDLLLEKDILQSIYNYLKSGGQPSDLLESLTCTWINFPSLLNELGDILYDPVSGTKSQSVPCQPLDLEDMFTMERMKGKDIISFESQVPASFSHECFISLFAKQLNSNNPESNNMEERLRIDAFLLQNGPFKEPGNLLYPHVSIFIRMLSAIRSRMGNEPFIYMDLLGQSMSQITEEFSEMSNEFGKYVFNLFFKCEKFLGMLHTYLEDECFFREDWMEILLRLLGRPVQLERFILMLVLTFHESTHLNVYGAILHSALSLVASTNVELFKLYLHFRLFTSTCLSHAIMGCLWESFSTTSVLAVPLGMESEMTMDSSPIPYAPMQHSDVFFDSIPWLVAYTHQQHYIIDYSISLGMALSHCCHYANCILSPHQGPIVTSCLSVTELYKLWSTPVLSLFVMELLRSNWPGNKIKLINAIGIRFEFLNILEEYFPLVESIPQNRHSGIHKLKTSSLEQLPVKIIDQLFVFSSVASDMEIIIFFCWLNYRIGYVSISSIVPELVLLEELAVRHGPIVALPILLFLVIHYELLSKADVHEGLVVSIDEKSRNICNGKKFTEINDKSISSTLILQHAKDLFSSLIFIDYFLGTIDELKNRTYPKIIKLFQTSSYLLPYPEQVGIIQTIYAVDGAKQIPSMHGEQLDVNGVGSSNRINAGSKFTWLASEILSRRQDVSIS